MDPEEKAKQALKECIQDYVLMVNAPVDIDVIVLALRAKGFRIAAMPTWGRDPSGRW